MIDKYLIIKECSEGKQFVFLSGNDLIGLIHKLIGAIKALSNVEMLPKRILHDKKYYDCVVVSHKYIDKTFNEIEKEDTYYIVESNTVSLKDYC